MDTQDQDNCHFQEEEGVDMVEGAVEGAVEGVVIEVTKHIKKVIETYSYHMRIGGL